MRNKIKDILEDNYSNTGFDLQRATEQLLNLFSVRHSASDTEIDQEWIKAYYSAKRAARFGGNVEFSVKGKVYRVRQLG